MVPVQVGEACSLGTVAEDVVFEVFEAAFDDYWIYFDSIQVKTLDCPSFDHRPGSIRHKTILTELEADGLSLCLKLRTKISNENVKIERIFEDYKQEIYYKKFKKKTFLPAAPQNCNWTTAEPAELNLRVCAPFSACKS